MQHFNRILILFICYSSLSYAVTKPEAKHGILDLRNYSFVKDGSINLTGEWEFYWGKLLSQKDINDKNIKPDGFISLPNTWNGFHTRSGKATAYGVATHRLKIIIGDNNQRLALMVPHIFSSYKISINGKAIASRGIASDNPNVYFPQTLPNIFNIPIHFDTLDLVLQVANYSFIKGGAAATIKLGAEREISSQRTRNLALDLFIFGALFITGIYHILLYLLRKKDISTLFFSFFCLAISFRSIALGETFFIEMFPGFPFIWHVKLLFISFFLGGGFFIRFLYHLFPKYFSEILTRYYLYLSFLVTSLLLLPINSGVFDGIINNIFQFITTLYILYITYKLSYITIKKNEGGLIALIGLIVLVIAGLNDILYDNQIVNTGYFAPFGLLFFIFSQSALLALKFSKAFTNVENLTFELTETNITFKKFVPEEFLNLLDKVNIRNIKRGDQIERSMAILFADIRSFTVLSEGMNPEENFNFINSYLDRMAPIIRYNNGFIDKFIGDAIMALFPDSVDDAVRTAIAMQEEIKNFNDFRTKLGKSEINVGIGIHYGSMMLGVIGEAERLEGTVISDTVNVAAHVENLTKYFGNKIIITEDVLNSVKDSSSIKCRNIGKMLFKRKKVPVSIYDVYSCCDEKTISNIDYTKEMFEKAINLYHNNELEQAVRLFENVLELNPDDRPAQKFTNDAKIQLENKQNLINPLNPVIFKTFPG